MPLRLELSKALLRSWNDAVSILYWHRYHDLLCVLQLTDLLLTDMMKSCVAGAGRAPASLVSSVLWSAKAGLTTCGGTEGCLPPPLPPPAPGCCRFPNIFHSRVLPSPDCGVWRPRWSLYLRVITKYVLCPAARISAKRHHRHQPANILDLRGNSWSHPHPSLQSRHHTYRPCQRGYERRPPYV